MQRPIIHLRAAAYTLSRMVSGDGSFAYQSLVSSIVLSTLHTPFNTFMRASTGVSEVESTSDRRGLTPEDALTTLINIITNTDPSPALISLLFSPILPELYSISASVAHKKSADPSLRSSLDGMLATWGRVVDTTEGIAVLWRIIDQPGHDWDVDIAGHIKRVER
jgi:hypothetical protein